MADSPDTVPDRADPVLVRPYIKTSGVAAQERPPEEGDPVWPAAASLPDAGEDPGIEGDPGVERDPLAEADTAVQAAIPASPPPYGLGVAPRLLILAAGIVVTLAVVAFVLFDSDAPDPQRPSSVLPAVTGPAAAPATSGTTGSSPSAQSSAGPSASSSASPSVSAAPSPSVSAPTPSVSVPAPPPATDRTGAIAGPDGRCLAMGGLLGIDGSPVQVYGCMDISAQEFTLATDGTLRVGGKCAKAGGDASVRVGGCDDQSAGQWQAGPDGTLVNGGQCLTDPGRAGANVRVAACAGSPEQTWTLPS